MLQRLFFVVCLLLFAVVAQPDPLGLNIGVPASIALNFDPSVSGDTGWGALIDPPWNSTLFVPLDFTKRPFTLEFWIIWVGRQPSTDPNAARVSDRQNQTLLFMGTKDKYIWVTPSNGVTPSESPNINVPGFFDGASKQMPAGPLRVKYAPGNFTSTLFSPTRGGWTKTALTFFPDNTAQFLVSDLPTSGTCRTCLRYLGTPFQLPDLTGVQGLWFGIPPYPNVAVEMDQRVPGQVKIAEIRVWDSIKTLADIEQWGFTSLPDDWPGLMNYWRGAEMINLDVASTGILLDSISTGRSRQANMTNGVRRPESESYAIQNSWSSTVPLTSYIRSINATEIHTFPIIGRGLGLTPTPQVVIRNYMGTMTSWSPPFGKWCVGAARQEDPSCVGLPISQPLQGFTQLNNTWIMSYHPDRSACGNTVQITFSSSFLSPQTDLFTTNDVTAILTVLQPPDINVTSVRVKGYTKGGIVSVQGVNLGAAGMLGVNEAIIFSGNGIRTSVNASVDTTGTILNVAYPPSVGLGYNFNMSLCGVVFSVGLDYLPPVIYNVTGRNISTVEIHGINFGPPRNVSAEMGASVMVNGSACIIDSINQDSIICTQPNIVPGQSYNVSVSIAGQYYATSFTFGLCANPCKNGGLCSNVNKCSCPKTFLGGTCDILAVCNPTCNAENGGECQSAGDPNNPLATMCYCPPGAPGSSANGCNLVNSDNLGTIVGASVGGVVGLAAIAGAVIFFILRRPARKAAKDFVPVHKKDFTRIIYGDQLTQVPEKNAGNIKGLEELLQQDLQAAFAISEMTQITEADKIAKALVVVYQDNDKAINLLQAFIDQEVETSESAGTLFRSNSMVSKMFKFYSRLIGLPYLYVTIGPELSKLLEEELGLEVDPEKMEEGKDLDEMRWSLMSQSQKILKQILVSDNECPTQFREIFTHLKKSVGLRFPDNINTTIGGFIFLRFFCPAVSSPEAYGIVDEPPSTTCRRLLILITKVMQNLSNDVEFGSKEPYMSKMNDFIQSNRLKLQDFYNRLTKNPTKPPVPCVLPKNIKALSLSILLAHVKENISKVTDAELRAKFEALV
eukprot:TRINITY_DN12528_c0_g1_i1.p1 TRINITY_DN12528_c0_g1~~TRINITY_DN12528_c0_g1_i1.p1  ORF type:complete len:1070 (+),score=179.39 TRINITY_DN12528_c0_g1_i1:67-3276(+)